MPKRNRDTSTLTITRTKTRSVFRRVWDEYYAWEAQFSGINLASTKLTSKEGKNGGLRTLNSPIATQAPKPVDDEKTYGSETFTIWNLGIPAPGEIVQVDVVTLTQFQPSPDYEASTPIPTNFLQGDDPNIMPFVPFADDPAFDAADYSLEHDDFAWQVSKVDPDLNAIILETSLRLHYDHGIPIVHIDEADILPKPLKTYKGVWGIIWISTQNDIVTWPGSSRKDRPPLLDLPTPDIGDLRTRLQDNITLVCPNLSCIQASCLLHTQYPVTLVPGDSRFDSEETAVDVRHHRKEKPCGGMCYLLHPDDGTSRVGPSWSPSERAQLRVILQLASTIPPCDLAVLCQKSCREIATMCDLLASEIPSEDYHVGTQEQDEHSPDFADVDALQFTPNDPCNHSGPCTPQAQCACVLNQTHCTRNCRCSQQCFRRWPGCRCGGRKAAKYGRSCLPDSCPCRRVGRECDPELCRSCFAPVQRSTRHRAFPSKGGQNHTCCNRQMQLDCRKALEVKRTEFGMGVFLAETAKEGDLISQYAGEMIYEATFQTRGHLANTRGRSYVYNLNLSMLLDGTYAGNETRFINHASEANANGRVSIFMVNGDHRIGVFAKRNIPAGAELFLDYGPEFPI